MRYRPGGSARSPAPGPAREAGLVRLHELLVRVAVRRAAAPGCLAPGIAGPELDDLAHQAAADAMIAIIAKLDTFRGESRFTTWAYRFVVLEVSSKLGRHYWRRHPSASLDAEDWDRLPDRFGLDPGEQAVHAEMITAIRHAVDQELTARQRRLFVGSRDQRHPPGCRGGPDRDDPELDLQGNLRRPP